MMPRAEDVLDRGLEALARGDGAELARLVELAAGVEWPDSEQRRRVAGEKHQALGKLLVLTRRNLRLLGRDGGRWLR